MQLNIFMSKMSDLSRFQTKYNSVTLLHNSIANHKKKKMDKYKLKKGYTCILSENEEHLD